MNDRFRTARARERRALEHLAGPQPLRRRALRLERFAALLVISACLVGLVGAFVAMRAVDRASGRQDKRITAVTTTRAWLYPDDQTVAMHWVADVTWTDRAGVAHSGQVAVRPQVPVGSRVAARLTRDGVVRSRPEPLLDVGCQVAGAWLGIVVLVLAFGLICSQAFGRVAERLRRESWRVAWSQWTDYTRA